MNTNNKISILTILIFTFIFTYASHEKESAYSLVEFNQLNKKLQAIKSKDEKAIQEYQSLKKKANELLKVDYFSVTHKSTLPPSGDKRDYLTWAPYFWPNPHTPDGLPYIRKDGEVNPETRDNRTDFKEKDEFFNAVEILSTACFYSNDKRYGKKASNLIYKWFVDEKTKMNPNLNYGQGIPGVNHGRSFGIIEFGGIRNVIASLEILDYCKVLEPEVKEGVDVWLMQYVSWLQESELGIMEKTRSNNHATTYDLQLCNILLYLDDTESMINVLEGVKKRIASQIEPDGSQPHELTRTKAFSYSTMNLSTFTKLAVLGQKFGVDLWNFETPDGRSIKKAYEFLIPYITTDKEWEYQQITKKDSYNKRFIKLLAFAAKTFNEPVFIKTTNNLK